MEGEKNVDSEVQPWIATLSFMGATDGLSRNRALIPRRLSARQQHLPMGIACIEIIDVINVKLSR